MSIDRFLAEGEFMARIPEEEIERLKKEVPVRQLAEQRGIDLKGHGDNLLGHCPFHADKTPSLVITPDKNLWHCLGACQAGGGPIDWVMRANGISFRHAVELLRADSPLAAGVASRSRSRACQSWPRRWCPVPRTGRC